MTSRSVHCIWDMCAPCQSSWFDPNRTLKTKELVGAGRFERPTPCAQDGFRHRLEAVCFQCFLFQWDTSSLLKGVEVFGIWRLRHPQYRYTQGQRSPLETRSYPLSVALPNPTRHRILATRRHSEERIYVG